MGARAFEGGCLCGSVRFRVSGRATNRCYCHCRSCRLASGAPFVAWASFPASGFAIVRGELAQYPSSKKVLRGFCPSCGSSMTYRHEDRPGDLDVALVTLDDAGSIAPECHIWFSEKPPWVTVHDELPRHAQWPEETD